MSTSSWRTVPHHQHDFRRAEVRDEQTLAAIRREAILTLAVPALSLPEAEAWAGQVADDRFRHDVQRLIQRASTNYLIHGKKT